MTDKKNCLECEEDRNVNGFVRGSQYCKLCFDRSKNICPSCNGDKNINGFMEGRDCRLCFNSKKRKPINADAHICTTCGGDKNINGFIEARKVCRLCFNIEKRKDSRAYKARNREHISDYNKEYKSENKEYVKEYNHDYNLQNREAIQKRQTEYQRERKKTDFEFKLAHTLRTRLSSALKAVSATKCKKTLELLGCSLEFLKAWFKSQFASDMTFQNHGPVWHIDHVKPCASFDLLDDDEQKKCFNWKNLQPLYGDENLSKNDTVDNKYIEKHKIKAKKFLEEWNESQT